MSVTDSVTLGMYFREETRWREIVTVCLDSKENP